MTITPRTVVIGANALGHDSAAFIILPEYEKVRAVSTERITRIKHDKLPFFPALEAIIRDLDIDTHSVERVLVGHTFESRQHEEISSTFYDDALAERKHHKVRFSKDLQDRRDAFKTFASWKKITHLSSSSAGRSLMASKLKEKLGLNRPRSFETFFEQNIAKYFPHAHIESTFFNHQDCHAVSSYYSSSFDEAILFSFDGWGDGLFSRVYLAQGNTLTFFAESVCERITVSETAYPREINISPGGVYAYFTHMLGFKPLSEEGKVEALAAFGSYDNEIYRTLSTLAHVDSTQKSIVFDLPAAKAFLHTESLAELIKQYSREDVAAAVQKFLEDIALAYVRFLVHETGIKNICLSGGTTANVIMNLAIFEQVTDSMHIVPAMADDGTAEGAALMLLRDHPEITADIAFMRGVRMPYYGTSYTKKQVRTALKEFDDTIITEDWGDSWPEKTASIVAEGKIGAIFHGRMEWGPRALGNRSIIADARRADFTKKINGSIKRRPLFQPFCPSILEEERTRLFEASYANKHMTCAFRMKEQFRKDLPAAVHIDGTARAQFVARTDNPHYHRLLSELKRITGYGIVINTSFNKHGRTIVETPRDAVIDFLDTDMDYVIIEGIKVTRAQPTI